MTIGNIGNIAADIYRRREWDPMIAGMRIHAGRDVFIFDRRIAVKQWAAFFEKRLEAVPKPQIRFKGKAQADEKAEHIQYM